MLKVIAFCFFLLSYYSTAFSQNTFKRPDEAVQTRYDHNKPVIHYTLTIDPANLTAFKVDIHITMLFDTLRMAMFAHPEYDDRYWRYIKNMKVDAVNDPS